MRLREITALAIRLLMIVIMASAVVMIMFGSPATTNAKTNDPNCLHCIQDSCTGVYGCGYGGNSNWCSYNCNGCAEGGFCNY